MAKTPTVMRYVFSILVGVFVFPFFAHATVTDQTQSANLVVPTGSGQFLFRLGTTTASMTINSIALMLAATDTPQTITVRITCFANTFSSSQTGCTDLTAHNSLDVPVVFGDRVYQVFRFATSSLVIPSGKVPLVEVIATTPSKLSLYGLAYGSYQFPNQCKYPTPAGTEYCFSTPYWQLNSSINWGALNLYTPSVFSSSSQGIATSSTLWESLATSTITNCANAGNIFSEGLCTAGSYLFMPSPDVLNDYANFPTLVQTKFPFSWVSGVSDAFDDLSASSTANFISVTIPFHDAGVGTTTGAAFGNFLPNINILSTSTVLTYISEAQWAFFQSLIALGLWLGLALDIFFTVRDRMHQHV